MKIQWHQELATDGGEYLEACWQRAPGQYTYAVITRLPSAEYSVCLACYTHLAPHHWQSQMLVQQYADLHLAKSWCAAQRCGQ